MKRITGAVFLLLVLGLANATAAPPTGGVYEFTAEGYVKRTPGRRTLRWDAPPGQVTALNQTAAEEKANQAVDAFLKELYPDFTEVPGTRKIHVRPIDPVAAKPNSTSVRLTLSCLGYVQQTKSQLRIFDFDVITDDVVTDKFDARLVVTIDGEEKTYDTSIRALGRGDPKDRDRFPTFVVWDDDFVPGDPAKTISVRVSHKMIPDPNFPNNRNDSFVEVGSFEMTITHKGGKLAADWSAGANTTEGKDIRSMPGLLTRRFIVKKPEALPFAVSALVVKQDELKAAREALLAEEWEKQEAMRKKLAAAGTDIKVFTGVAQGKGGIGVGRLVVISANLEKATKYAAEYFPNEVSRKTVVIATTEDEAKSALRAAFKEAHPSGQLDGEPQLVPKPGRTEADKVMELPPRPKKK
jgi:hypothetical protein